MNNFNGYYSHSQTAMSSDKSTSSTDEIEGRIRQVGTYSRAVRTAFVIVSAFLLAVGIVLPANLESASQAIESIHFRPFSSASA